MRSTRRQPPERRTRADVVVGALLGVLVLVAAVVFLATSEAAGTGSEPAAAAITAPPAATAVPEALVEAWRAPSAATDAPVVVGDGIVTGDGSEVVGRNAGDGSPAWTFRRGEPLCTVSAGFTDLTGDSPRALAVYRNGEWCSELTALRPDTGVRADARNPDLRPGTTLITSNGLVAGTGADSVEVMRTDLVRTVQYGRVEAVINPGRQPRPNCVHSSAVLGGDRLAVVERCPDEPTDRLSVIVATEAEDGKPVERFSTPLSAAGALVVAVTGDRVAVALPGPARLLVLDGEGRDVGEFPLEVPDGFAATATGGTPITSDDGRVLSWWTGTSTILLDQQTLTPVATVPGALGPAVTYAGTTLVPVPDGLAVLDPSGEVERTVAVPRADRTAPVRVAAQGAVLVEQRGPEIVGLLPAG